MITPVALSTRLRLGRSSSLEDRLCSAGQLLGGSPAARRRSRIASRRSSIARRAAVDRKRVGRLQRRGELVDGGQLSQLCGLGGVIPRTHSPSSFFQIGA